MMMKRVAILVLALLPVGASAQGVPLRTAPASGITVTGHGSIRVPVKTLQFLATARGNVDETATLAAMRAAGIVDPSMGPLGSTVSANQPTMLRGTIPNATQQKLERVALAAAEFVRQHAGTAFDNVSFIPRLDDCGTPEQAARTAAFAEARRKAEAIASLAELTIDGVQSVNETGGCPTTPDAPQFGSNGPLDLGTLTTSVMVSETITFAVSPAANGARRRTL
jgi:hypothetical protein